MTTPVTKLPAIPALGKVDRTLQPILSAVKEVLEVHTGKRGNPLDRVLTLRDALDSGMASMIRIGGNTYYGSGSSGIVPGYQQPDYAIPPAVEGLRAVGALQTIILDWEPQNYVSFSYVEIWRAAVDDLGQAVKVGQTPSFVYTDEVGPGAVRFYWVRAVNKSGTLGAFNAVAGTRGETALDPAYTLTVLTGQITESQLYANLNARINLIDAPTTGLVALTAALQQADSVLHARVNDARAQADAAQAALGESVLYLSGEVNRARDLIRNTDYDWTTHRDAVFYTDPGNGAIKIYAVDAVKSDLDAYKNTVSIDLDAVRAEIALRASRVWVDGLQTRLTSAEVVIDGQAGSITQHTSDISALDGRLDTAETTITQHDGAINLRATVTYVDQVAADILAGLTPAYAWEFNGTVEGWTATNATLTANSATVTLDGTATDPSFEHLGLVYDGGQYTTVLMRFQRVAGTGWNGRVYYATDGHAAFSTLSTYAVGAVVKYNAGSGEKVWVCHTAVAAAGAWTGATNWTEKGLTHGFSASYYKTFANPGNTGYHTVSVSMKELTAGGTDYVNTYPSGVRVQFGVDTADTFEIDSVSINKSSIEQTLFNDLEARLSQAEVDIDANTASITLKATQVDLNNLTARVTTAEADINAAEASITLKASQADLTALTTRVGTAEVDINAAEAAILLKASQSDLTALTTRVSTAEVDIDGLQATITLKADQTTLNALDTRVDTAELTISAQQGKISQSLSSVNATNAQSETTAEAVLRSLTTQADALDDARLIDARVAVAEQSIATLTTDVAAEASARLLLAVQVDANLAAITSEKTARVTADHAEAVVREALAVRVGDAEAAITSESTARSNGDAAEAAQRNTLAAQIRGSYTGTDPNALTTGLVYEERSARVSADNANATSISQVQARLDTGDYAAVKVQSQASANSITGLYAEHTVKVDVNGYVAGFGLSNSGPTVGSEFVVLADRFAMVTNGAAKSVSSITRSGSTATAASTAHGYSDGDRVTLRGATQSAYNGLFVISGVTANTFNYTVSGAPATPATGTIVARQSIIPFVIGTVAGKTTVAISNAAIQDAAITSAKIGLLAVENAHIKELAAAKILAGTIDVALTLNAATINSGVINSGTLNSGTINGGTITGSVIQTATGTGERVVINDASSNRLKVYDASNRLISHLGSVDLGLGNTYAQFGHGNSGNANSGVTGLSYASNGVFGWSATGPGVKASSTTSYGVDAFSNDANAIRGWSVSGSSAIYGFTGGSGDGVYGNSSGGSGVRGYSDNGAGVYANSLNGVGVYGTSNSQYGVHGYTTGGVAAVFGQNTSTGAGVYGSSVSGAGVTCHSANQSALRLIPRPSFPSSPNVGDIFCYDAGAANSNNGLWVYLRRTAFSTTDWVRFASL